jgi:hypothetical protein
MPIHTIPMSVMINNATVFTETLDTLLNPGDTIGYTFVQSYTVPTASEQQPYYQMKVELSLSCDGNLSNNSHSKYYNVDIPGSIDLAIISIYNPEADSSKEGFTKVYSSIKVENKGTGYAQGAVLYVFIDSASIQVWDFSEMLDDIPGQDSINYTCKYFYPVPNFNDVYTVSFYIAYADDKDVSNNSASVTTHAKEVIVGINEMSEKKCSMGQNIPNPATATTVIPYVIPQEGKVSFKVMSINGQILYGISRTTHY